MILKGFTFKGIDSSTYKLTVKTQSLPVLPSRRSVQEYVLGKDNPFDFEDGYNRKRITLNCEINAVTMPERRYYARLIAAWLSGEGDLILNYEPDKVYSARVLSVVNATPSGVYDKIIIAFEVDLAKSTYYNEGLTWDEADMIWLSAEIPWDGLDQTFTGTGTHTVNNLGTYKALPIIELTGTASSITLTLGDLAFTYTGLNGTIYIDCDNKLVYSGTTTKTNQRANFSGDYLELDPGENDIVVSGTVTDISIYYNFKNTYL